MIKVDLKDLKQSRAGFYAGIKCIKMAITVHEPTEQKVDSNAWFVQESQLGYWYGEATFRTKRAYDLAKKKTQTNKALFRVKMIIDEYSSLSGSAYLTRADNDSLTIWFQGTGAVKHKSKLNEAAK